MAPLSVNLPSSYIPMPNFSFGISEFKIRSVFDTQALSYEPFATKSAMIIYGIKLSDKFLLGNCQSQF